MIKAVTKQKDKTSSTFCWWSHVVCAICAIWLRERGRASNKNHNGYKTLLQMLCFVLLKKSIKIEMLLEQSTRNRTVPPSPAAFTTTGVIRSIGKIRLIWKNGSNRTTRKHIIIVNTCQKIYLDSVARIFSTCLCYVWTWFFSFITDRRWL